MTTTDDQSPSGDRARKQDRTLSLGVFGCADVAVRRVLPAIAAVDGIRLAAVASRTLDRAKEVTARFGGEPVVGYERLLDRADVDAVYVPLPTGLHAKWVRLALLAGKHVLAEKPLTTNYRETLELVELAESTGLVLRENYMFVAHSQHEWVARQLAENAIGELRGFTGAFTIPPRPATDVRYRADLGGGSLLDNGVYPVRAAQLFLGQELTVLGASLDHDESSGVDLVGAALLRDTNGVTAQVSFGMRHMYVSSYQLHGATGRITVDRAYAPPAQYQPTVLVERQNHREFVTLPADDQYAKSITAFVDQVAATSAPDHAATLRQAILVDEIANQAKR